MTYRAVFRHLSLATGLSLVGLTAQASWIDSDFYCRVYGCVIVHDGVSFDVYDVYDFSTGSTVPAGGQLIPWTGNPIQGSGSVNPVYTGTITEALPPANIDALVAEVGFDLNGDSTIDAGPGATAEGYLDATGMFDPVELIGNVRFTANDVAHQKSFYLSSRTDFYLTAQASLLPSTAQLGVVERLENVRFLYGITTSGNDDGMAFGADARSGNSIRIAGNVDDLGDLVGAPVNIVEFTNAIRRRNSDSLPAQSVRFDYTYGFEGYDLSLGTGQLRYEMEFDFYNR